MESGCVNNAVFIIKNTVFFYFAAGGGNFSCGTVISDDPGRGLKPKILLFSDTIKPNCSHLRSATHGDLAVLRSRTEIWTTMFRCCWFHFVQHIAADRV